MGRRQWAGVLLALSIVAFCFTPHFHNWVNFPSEVRIMAGSSYHLKMPLPIGMTVRADKAGLSLNNREVLTDKLAVERGDCALFSAEPGQVSLEFRLLDLLPLRRLNVQVVSPVEVVPSGHSVGVAIRATTMVVGYTSVKSNAGQTQPAKDAGFRLGDLVVMINNRHHPTVGVVAEEIERSGRNNQEIRFVVRREGQEHPIKVKPVMCSESGKYRIGLYVRDDAAGVGTLTFVDRQSGIFGALGHVITDVDTNRPLVIEDGRIMRSKVTSIDQGRTGHPGEKRSIIVDEHKVVGRFETNTSIGIFGEMLEDITEENIATPVAMVDQVQVGPAQIWTVINGEKVEAFDIEIVRVIKQQYPGSKGLVLRVTDPRLLKQTGGIVQGMSGSPILQNGHLVGAVTHVFVNDPTKGYGVFAEWMIRESGLLEKREEITPTFFYRRYRLGSAGL